MIPEVHITDNHVQELLNRLAESEETLRAIRHGEIDGLVVQTPHGERVFTLKGAEQPYRVMVEAMEEGAATLGTDGTILYCNRRFAAMLQIPHENVLGASVTACLAPESQAEFARLLAGCRRESMRGEVELLAQDGRRVPVSLACSTLPNSEIESICLVATDLTARMEAEAAIQQLNEELEARVEARTAELARANEALRQEIAERRQAEQERERLLAEVERRVAELDATLGSVADGLVIYDTRGVPVRINDAAQRILHYRMEERELAIPERITALRVAKPDGIPFTPDETPAMRALRGESVSGVIMVLRRPHGVIWTSVSAAPVVTDEGTIHGAVVIFTDITGLHDLQEQQRTLLHLVSHDLRIPLAIVNGHTELVQERLGGKVDGTPVADSLAAIGRGIRRMNTMIEDLTDLARLEGKQFQLNREPLALVPCLADFLSQASAVLDVDRVRLDMPEDLPPVLADNDRLYRIVTNLLSNALKYSDAGTLVRVGASRQGDEVVIFVTDQGRGIAAVDLPHLFERFYRAQSERRAEGIGLGLYITRLLVEAHAVPAANGKAMVGGRIWVDSERGNGSTFHFTLPTA